MPLQHPRQFVDSDKKHAQRALITHCALDLIIETLVESPKIVEKNEATFLTKMTEYLDVYEIFIFDKTKGKKARIGYAGIPDIKTSVMMKEWFKTVEDEIYVKYRKHPVNDKWIPQFLVKEEC